MQKEKTPKSYIRIFQKLNIVIIMPLPELEPITFRPYDVVKTFEEFEKKVNDYSKVFSDISEIEGYLDNFIKKHPELAKPLRTKALATKHVRFELTPMIAMLDSSIKMMTHELNLIEDKKLSPVALKPKDAVEGLYYHCDMFVPIPDDMLNIESEEVLLKEHFNLMNETIDNEFRRTLYELKPLGIVTRVCGWNGSWIVYSYTMRDDPSVAWSTPLVDSPYRSTQPFLAVKNGEFVILEDDLTPEDHIRVEDVKTRINARTKGIEGLELKVQEAIPVDMAWVLAHAINTDKIVRGYSLKHAIKDFGQHIPDLTIHEARFKGNKLLEALKEDVIEESVYRFKLENIRKHIIRYK
jgi:hypothetical protein